MPMESLTTRGFLLRLAVAVALVAMTYNPTGHSYVHWLAGSFPAIGPLQAVAGLLLLGAWGFFIHATWRSLGTAGVLFASALAAALIWLLVSWHWFSLRDTGVISWLALASLAILLAVGVSWSHIRRRVTGQTDVDEVDRR
jgi:Family of unknown function (DUF6524)